MALGCFFGSRLLPPFTEHNETKKIYFQTEQTNRRAELLVSNDTLRDVPHCKSVCSRILRKQRWRRTCQSERTNFWRCISDYRFVFPFEITVATPNTTNLSFLHFVASLISYRFTVELREQSDNRHCGNISLLHCHYTIRYIIFEAWLLQRHSSLTDKVKLCFMYVHEYIYRFVRFHCLRT